VCCSLATAGAAVAILCCCSAAAPARGWANAHRQALVAVVTCWAGSPTWASGITAGRTPQILLLLLFLMPLDAWSTNKA
jgi:hypothetical protein